VCKSLYLPDDFLASAHSIRNKYYPETKGELSSNSTTYNVNKIRGMCEVCNNHLGEETHHLSPQRSADKDGFIGTFHKNHPANLLTVCQKCHDNFHSGNISSTKDIIKKKTKTTGGYILL